MYARTLTELKAGLRDYAKPNRFSVLFVPNFPSVSVNLDISHFLIKAVTIPTYGPGIINIEHLGRRVQIPGDAVYGDFNVTLRIDADYKIYNGMHNWTKSIINQEGEITQASVADSLGGSAIITVLDHKLEPQRIFTIYNVFPTVVGELVMDMDSTDVPAEYTVSFAYSHFKQEAAG